jgi:hypothetical protein
MKTLKEYIIESCDEKKDCKSMTFNLKGMDDIDDIKKQLGEIENCEVEDDVVTLSACKDCENTNKAYEILKKYSDAQRNSQHRSSDEQYAQKTLKLKEQVDALNEYMHEPEPEEEPEEKKDEKEGE